MAKTGAASIEARCSITWRADASRRPITSGTALELPVIADVDELFYEEWVHALFQGAVADLRAATAAANRSVMFTVF